MNGEPPKLLDRVRAAARLRHFSPRTEEAYVGWIKRFILFHGKRHPSSMGAGEVNQFLSSLAVEKHVSAATQNQALSALLFLYRVVLEDPLPWLDDIVRAPRPMRVPVVLSVDEVRSVMGKIEAFRCRLRQLPLQRRGKPYPPETTGEILLVRGPYIDQMFVQQGYRALRQHRPPIMPPLRVAHHDLPPGKVEILDSQLQRLE